MIKGNFLVEEVGGPTGPGEEIFILQGGDLHPTRRGLLTIEFFHSEVCFGRELQTLLKEFVLL